MICKHPATALRSWYGRDDSAPNGRVLVVVCTKCRTVLKGEAKL